MSTPATYRFIARSAHESDQTFYIHHDGYVEGAACYLWEAIQYASEPDAKNSLSFVKDCKSGLAGAFFRANGRAEFTKSHVDYGADYQYDIDEKLDLVKVKKRSYTGDYVHVACKSIADFVNDHANPEWLDGHSPVASAKQEHTGKHFFTVSNGEKVAELLEEKAATFDKSNPNRKGYFNRAKSFRVKSSGLTAQVC